MSGPTERPGGRTARVRRDVLRATGDILAEGGFEALDPAEVARRADVGRTTVYRRWRGPTGLVADLLTQMADDSVPRTETGGLLGDLEAQASLVRRTLSDPRQGRLFKAVIAAATCDDGTAAALQRFYDARTAEWAPCVEAAVERGEAPAGTDPAAVIRAVSAPLYYGLLTRTEPLTGHDARAAAHAADAAVRAGVFVRAERPGGGER
ncbi:TetR/AcrR family transcriptional regulator [Tsukamurella sp. 1534]|uniref:TetR/AcrR family transcriptional regulator n=1 Tax=Tsukamurella sp. 1534 TaxID=1151061 RepID=UPI00030C7BC3|nr:TetR/AcrR family transcriptional regulator [Tsukamurella sp. 1534]